MPTLTKKAGTHKGRPYAYLAYTKLETRIIVPLVQGTENKTHLWNYI